MFIYELCSQNRVASNETMLPRFACSSVNSP